LDPRREDHANDSEHTRLGALVLREDDMKSVALLQALALLLGVDITLLTLGVIYLVVLIRRAFRQGGDR